MKNSLIIFLKYPEAGKVKTRLGAVIGDETAAGIYRQLVEGVIFACAVPEYEILLFIEPYDRLHDFKNWLGEGFQFFPQTGKDLGERMLNALKTAFGSGFNKCIIIGSDIPDVNADIVFESFDILEEKDCVIGPCEDGGYYLLGFKDGKIVEKCFQNIEWSTEKVYKQTIDALNGSTFGITEKLRDLDTADDLEFFRKSLNDRGIEW